MSLSLPISLLISFIFLPICCLSQASPPVQDTCNGIFLTYLYKERFPIHPFLSDPNLQPYSFKSTATILNAGHEPLKSWNLFIGFQHDEILVSLSPAVLTDGTALPAHVGNGTFLSGFPLQDLKTAIETAGDVNQIQVQIELVGTQFGVRPPNVPLPSNLSLANDGFKCPPFEKEGTNLLYVCCTKDPDFKEKIIKDDEFLPRRDGDLTIAYDVLQSFDLSYLASVAISNHNPLGRLDHWKLKWEWMRGEFISSMKGAYTSVTDASDCLFGKQGSYYKDFDFTKVMNCERSPTILDLPLTKARDTNIGLIPYCCRNGTILPPSMDPSKSTSAFQLQVFKMPPDLNRTQLFAPQNWKISGTLNPDYQCSPPVRVSPTQFPDSSGLQATASAIASWQVVCNIKQPKGVKPWCCVSFSAFHSDSVVPCQTCACGCPSNSNCNAVAPSLLLPPDALLVPFDNRTKKTLYWAKTKHFQVPKVLPCGDNCGVSINWHVNTDNRQGWSARITLFNWADISFADWFTAIQFDKASAGYQAMYSFNGSTLPGLNNTIFMHGLPGLNYLVAETDGPNPARDPRLPGKQQTVISFTKKTTPRIDVVGGDGFPSKVFFNGEECSLPSTIPTSLGYRTVTTNMLFTIVLALTVVIFAEKEQ